MSFVIRCEGWPRDLRCPVEGQYLRWYDPDGDETKPIMEWCLYSRDAKKFASSQEAMDMWNAVRTIDPIRPDGEPNKPLTAYHISVQPTWN